MYLCNVSNNQTLIIMQPYLVKYRVEGSTSSSTCQTTINLMSGSESEAISELVRRGSVRSSERNNVIILDIRPR